MSNKLKKISDACEVLFTGLQSGDTGVNVMREATRLLQAETRYQATMLKYREARGERPEIEGLEGP
jgi:hypothetical protein